MAHPLSGPRAKVQRAKLQIRLLEQRWERFANLQAYRAIVAERNPRSGKHCIRLAGYIPPPLEFSIIVGEIAHNLRSALDQLFCELVIAHKNGTISDCNDPGVSFPIYTAGPTARRHCFPTSKLSKQIGASWTARLAARQPYKRGNGHRRNVLWHLREMNDFDKHRRIPLAGLRMRHGMVSAPLGLPGAPFAGWDLRLTHRRVTLENGAKIGEVSTGGYQGEMHVESEIAPQIVFGKGCETIEGQPVLDLLLAIANHVHDIIESFAEDLA
jgi:hypothetical protein